jgi:hypothetical protein
VRRAVPLLAGWLAAGLVACGSDEPPTPAACLAGASGFERALARAPAEVDLGGGTRISSCLVSNQPVGELTEVGAAMVGAATQLARNVGSDADRRAATELGFLVGAVARGAAGTSGIHSELERRLESASQTGLAGARRPLRRAYGKGYAAGQDHG